MSRFISELTSDSGKVKKIRNKKKKQKFDGFEQGLSPKHRPYSRLHEADLQKLLEKEDEQGNE